MLMRGESKGAKKKTGRGSSAGKGGDRQLNLKKRGNTEVIARVFSKGA